MRSLLLCILLAVPPVIASGQASDSQPQAPTSSVVQKPFTFGIAGGAGVPFGDLSSVVNMGYNVSGMLGFQPATLPVGFRLTTSYNSFGVKKDIVGGGSGVTSSGRGTIVEATANVIYNIPIQSTVTPYVTGGIGIYHENSTATFTDTASGTSASGSGSQNNAGFNVGGGLSVNLGGMNAFIEARYHHVSGGDAFLPVVVGVSF